MLSHSDWIELVQVRDLPHLHHHLFLIMERLNPVPHHNGYIDGECNQYNVEGTILQLIANNLYYCMVQYFQICRINYTLHTQAEFSIQFKSDAHQKYVGLCWNKWNRIHISLSHSPLFFSLIFFYEPMFPSFWC